MEESLPNIKGGGYLVAKEHAQGTANGTIYEVGGLGAGGYWIQGIGTFESFNASLSSSTYQDNAHVRPLSINTTFLMKY